ncbi:MAG: zinc ABC transporter substrate-binding protein [Planctomycetes bacterium]|nr:zinc ABC transporter substrate-binding protein [Planctomycetota bacterium]
MKKSCLYVLLLLIPGYNNAIQEKKIKVVTTLNFLAQITEEIGKELVKVDALSHPLQDPHYVIPTPNMSQLAKDADLFVETGLGLELWADNIIQSSGNPNIQSTSQLGRLQISKNISILELPSETSRAWGDIHPQGNPHVWLDPVNIKIIAENIGERLIKLLGKHKETIGKNLIAYKHKIDERLFGDELLKEFGKDAGEILTRKLERGTLLDYLQTKKLDNKLGGWLKQMLKLKGSGIITYHKTYVYFAKRFGLEIVGEIEERPGIPPEPKRKESIVKIGKEHNVKFVITNNFYPIDPAKYVSDNLDAKLIVAYIDVGGTDSITSCEDLIDNLIDALTKDD